MHPNAALRERERDPAGPDPKLKRGALAGHIDKEVNDTIDDRRLERGGVPLVIALSHALAEESSRIVGLSQKPRARKSEASEDGRGGRASFSADYETYWFKEHACDLQRCNTERFVEEARPYLELGVGTIVVTPLTERPLAFMSSGWAATS